MKNKNEIFRWIIVAICTFEVYRKIKNIIKVIADYDLAMLTSDYSATELKNLKYATPLQVCLTVITILSLLAIIYYFVFCFGKQVKTKLLGSALLVNSGCDFVLILASIINFNRVLDMPSFVEDTYYNLCYISSYLQEFVVFVVLLLVATAIFKNIQNNKSIKIFGIVLFVLYILTGVLNIVSNYLWYSTFDTEIVRPAYEYLSLVFDFGILIRLLTDLYILFYIFFMDKDYKRVKQIEE